MVQRDTVSESLPNPGIRSQLQTLELRQFLLG
jgi:hypothetical protein